VVTSRLRDKLVRTTETDREENDTKPEIPENGAIIRVSILDLGVAEKEKRNKKLLFWDRKRFEKLLKEAIK
jgi:hypothetical protein